MMRLLPVLFLLVPMVAPAADEGDRIYRTVDEDGNVVFTDTPPSGDSEPVELEPIVTVPAYRDEDSGGTDTAVSDTVASTPAYEALEITYPTPDQAIRHNGGLVPFEVALRPGEVVLAEGHRIEIVVDGNASGSGRGPTVTTRALDRGPHNAFARVVDAGGNMLVRSQPVNFFLLRKSLQQ